MGRSSATAAASKPSSQESEPDAESPTSASVSVHHPRLAVAGRHHEVKRSAPSRTAAPCTMSRRWLSPHQTVSTTHCRPPPSHLDSWLTAHCGTERESTFDHVRSINAGNRRSPTDTLTPPGDRAWRVASGFDGGVGSSVVDAVVLPGCEEVVTVGCGMNVAGRACLDTAFVLGGSQRGDEALVEVGRGS